MLFQIYSKRSKLIQDDVSRVARLQVSEDDLKMHNARNVVLY